MKHIYALLILILFLLPGIAFCQSFSTRVSAATIGKKDVLQVEYVAENLDLQELTLPVFSGWSILSGPNFSSNRMQTGNIVKQQIIYTITLQPQATGRLTIPGARATINNKARVSNSVSVEVKNEDHLQGNNAAQQPAQPPGLFDELLPQDVTMNDEQVLKKGETARDKIQNNLLVTLQVSKKTAFVGEPILATYKLCTRIRSQSRVLKQPSFSGCTVVEMTSAEDPLPQREQINGKLYNVYIIRQVQLIPLQPGVVHLGSTSVENKISFYRQGQFSYRDLFYSNPAVKPEVVTVTFENKPVDLEVKALPQPVPVGFGGAVGNFNLSFAGTDQGGASGNNNEVKVQIDGAGNLQQSPAPAISWPAGLEGFEPTVKDDIDKTVFPSPVSRVYTFPYVASKAGGYTIPPVSFVYFNADKQQYVTLLSQPLKVQVARATQTVVHAAKSSSRSTDFYSRLYIILGLGLLAILVGIILYNRSNKVVPAVAAAQPAEVPKPVSAPPDTDQYIYQIRELEPTADGMMFYKQLNRSLTGWLAAKYNITTLQLEEYARQHPDKNYGLQRLIVVLNACSIGMYTPLYNIEEAVQHRLSALEALNMLERIS